MSKELKECNNKCKMLDEVKTTIQSSLEEKTGLYNLEQLWDGTSQHYVHVCVTQKLNSLSFKK